MQRLVSHFRREEVEKVYRLSEGTADHTKSQKALQVTVEHIINECKKKGTTYTDDEFPIDANESADVLTKIKQWRRVKYVTPRSANRRTTWRIFDDPQPSDVAQGNLGDCWLVSAIALISDKPHILQRIFVTKKYNKQGVYGLQLCVDGEWKYVIVDDRFPCNNQGELLFAWGKKMQLWVPLLEKAIAKLFGSYSALNEGGNMSISYTYLTGAPVEVFFSAKHLLTGDDRKKTFSHVRYALKDKLLLSSSTIVTDDNGELRSVGLEMNHSYSLLNTTVVDRDHRLLLLRNTWGRNSFTGKWSPHSDQWNTVTDKNSVPANTGDADKGIFWILIEDLAKYFNSIHICYTRGNYYEYHIKAAVPRAESDEWETFEVEVTEETCIDMSFKPIEGIVSKYKIRIPTTVFMFDDNDNLIGSTDCHAMHLAIWKAKVLAPGIYRICVFTFTKWNATENVEYNFLVQSSREVVCRKISKPIIELRNHLAKLVVMLGTKHQVEEVTLYTLQGDLWFRLIIVASNNSQETEIGCAVKKSCYDNVISTRTLGDTGDGLPPRHSQILQILSVDDLVSGAYRTDFHISVQDLIAEESSQPNHYPPVAGNLVKLHKAFLTSIISK